MSELLCTGHYVVSEASERERERERKTRERERKEGRHGSVVRARFQFQSVFEDGLILFFIKYVRVSKSRKVALWPKPPPTLR